MTIAEEDLTALEHALIGFETAFNHVLKVVEDGGLGDHDDAGFVRFVQGFERVRKRTALVDHRVVRDGIARGLPQALSQPSMTAALAATLRIGRGEASRRVRAAAAVGDRVTMLGDPQPPLRPVLAAAQRAGEVSQEHVGIIERALDAVDRSGFDPNDLAGAERVLTEFAATSAPLDLARLAQQVVDRLDPDGSRPEDEIAQDRRHLALRPNRDGSYRLEGRLTPALGAKLTAILSPLAKPRVGSVEVDGHTVDLPDERHVGQRWHDALDDMCDRVLHAGDTPASGGTPTTLIITIDWDDLLARAGYGTSSDGTLVPVAQVLAAAGEADVVPTVLTASGAVLTMGRTRRVATPMQTLALNARDGGCSFPGCAHPPEWCERHHVVAWIDGGLTDLDNLTLLCRYHHHNFLLRGWTCTMDGGLPSWIPPRWVDPARRPLRNTRIVGAQTARRLRR